MAVFHSHIACLRFPTPTVMRKARHTCEGKFHEKTESRVPASRRLLFGLVAGDFVLCGNACPYGNAQTSLPNDMVVFRWCTEVCW